VVHTLSRLLLLFPLHPADPTQLSEIIRIFFNLRALNGNLLVPNTLCVDMKWWQGSCIPPANGRVDRTIGHCQDSTFAHDMTLGHKPLGWHSPCRGNGVMLVGGCWVHGSEHIFFLPYPATAGSAIQLWTLQLSKKTRVSCSIRNRLQKHVNFASRIYIEKKLQRSWNKQDLLNLIVRHTVMRC